MGIGSDIILANQRLKFVVDPVVQSFSYMSIVKVLLYFLKALFVIQCDRHVFQISTELKA